jgi:PAS domain-containing protein
MPFKNKQENVPERALLRAIFDALPSLIFVVDRDVRIQEYNAAAAELLHADREEVLLQRAGEILHCIHAADAPGGCGNSAACRNCVIRSSVVKAFLGNRVVRRRAKIEISRRRTGSKMEMFALVTVSPFSFQGTPHALLVIEDISEIADLYRTIRVCPICGKMQDEGQSWMRIEAYFKNNWDVDCSHNYCPDCFQKEMDKFRAAKDKSDD